MGSKATSAPDTRTLTENTFVTFGDLDASPTKAWVVGQRNEPENKRYYDFAFARRPREELYVVADDPDQIRNVAGVEKYAAIREKLHDQLMAELERTKDPRVTGGGMTFEKPPFAGPPARPRRARSR